MKITTISDEFQTIHIQARLPGQSESQNWVFNFVAGPATPRTRSPQGSIGALHLARNWDVRHGNEPPRQRIPLHNPKGRV
ncbi:hypothetical protein ACFX2G_004714 [Malus domestica]